MIKNILARSCLMAFLVSVGVKVTSHQTLAQSERDDCPIPQSNEYTLLVLTQTSETQQQVRRAFPETAKLEVCQYGENVVTRIGGFSRFESANSWGKYIKDNLDLLTIVQPPNYAQASPPGFPGTPVNPLPRTSISQTPAGELEYNLQALGRGYAVLVDYFSNPDIAYQIKNNLGRNIGLVSYFARPYLLISYTQSEAEANATARNLSQGGFSAAVVDSTQVTVLTTDIE